MNFEDFLELVPKIKNIDLPGQASQFKMMPGYRFKFIKIQEQAIKTARQSAVLSLFYPNYNHQTSLALILRKSYHGVHSAQIGFPGGKVEHQDLSLMHTALRETQEEIGVNPNYVTILKQLTHVYIPPSNFRVQPYVGITQKTPNFILQEDEVEALLEVPLIDFFDDSKIVNGRVMTSYNKLMEVPAFAFNGYIVWGATAMILSEVKDLLKAVL